MGSISIYQLLIVLVIVGLIFGTRHFRTIGRDLGHFIRDLRSAGKSGEDS